MMMPTSSQWPDVGVLVPHSGVARLITSVSSFSATSIKATGAISPEHPLVVDGAAPALLVIELAAQAAAAMEAIGRRTESGRDESARAGSLVRIREAQFSRTLVPAGASIVVTADVLGSAPPLAIYAIRATMNDVEVGRGVISTHAGQAPTGDRS
jgi:predicted hotdog family 3-hydroxylacyl-ACP dehydratase